MNQLFCLIAVVLVLASGQQCDISEGLRTDCGYMGIDQYKCEAKGCCWKPTQTSQPQPKQISQEESAQIQQEQPAQISQQKSGGTPWCFFPRGQNPCENISFSWTGGMGFDSTFYNKMYALFDANIDIQGKGGIVAAPDHSTPGGSYYYHWMRDAALTMRTYMQLNNFQLSKVETKMKSYVNWVGKVQNEVDPQGFDVRINPKFELPNGEVYVGGWCRPQTDGPGLRSGALLLFAELLNKNGQSGYVNSNLVPKIKFDLDWVMANWQSDGCDLWEEVRSNDFFWNRAGYVYTLELCEKFFNSQGDSSYASKCASAKSSVKNTLDGHWTGSFFRESTNRQKDSAVIHALSSFFIYPISDSRVTKTIQVLTQTFCSEYAINQQENKAGIPGVLMGRYPGDSYAGGNPWQLLTAVLGKIFYQGASALVNSDGFQSETDRNAWVSLLKLPKSASLEEQVRAALNAGDSVMYRLYQHVKNDNGHIAQQIDRNSGVQKSANDLTWSYANILSAIQEREKATSALQSLNLQQTM